MLEHHAEDLGQSVSSGSDSPLPAGLLSSQVHKLDFAASHSSTGSASTSEVRIAQQPCSSGGTPGNSTAICLGDYVKQEEIQQCAGSSSLPYDLAASAAAAAARGMAAASSAMAASAASPQAATAVANNVVVEGSTASLVTWGPPEFQQTRPMPPPVVTVPPSVFAGNIPGLPGNTLIPTPSPAAASPQLQAGHDFRRSNTGGPAPAAAGLSNISSPFLPATLSAPPMSQAFYDESMIDQSLRLPSTNSARLTKKSSGGCSGPAAAAATAATAAGHAGPGVGSNTGKAAGGGRGGRRPSAATTGRPATGVIKDTTRRKAAEIARLEEEVQQKLKVVSDLEKEREELERRERLLKLQVRGMGGCQGVKQAVWSVLLTCVRCLPTHFAASTLPVQVRAGERHIFCQSINGITPHLKNLIQAGCVQRRADAHATRASLVSWLPAACRLLT